MKWWPFGGHARLEVQTCPFRIFGHKILFFFWLTSPAFLCPDSIKTLSNILQSCQGSSWTSVRRHRCADYRDAYRLHSALARPCTISAHRSYRKRVTSFPQRASAQKEQLGNDSPAACLLWTTVPSVSVHWASTTLGGICRRTCYTHIARRRKLRATQQLRRSIAFTRRTPFRRETLYLPLPQNEFRVRLAITQTGHAQRT